MPRPEHPAPLSDPQTRARFAERVGRQESRKLSARRGRDRNVWLGLGMLGLVGWSVATPPLVGAALGAWLDSRWPLPCSWTLTLLLGGLVFGCANAWLWVTRERREIVGDAEDSHDR